MTNTPEQLQRARNIAADAFVANAVSNVEQGVELSFKSFQEWGRHVDSYSRFMREGAYDSDIAVQAALMALNSVDLESA